MSAFIKKSVGGKVAEVEGAGVGNDHSVGAWGDNVLEGRLEGWLSDVVAPYVL